MKHYSCKDELNKPILPIDYEFKWISENPEAARRKYLLERNVKQLYTARVQLETSTTQTDKIIRIG